MQKALTETQRRNEPLPELVSHLLKAGKMDVETRWKLKTHVKSILMTWPTDVIELNDIIRELWYRFQFIPVTRNKVMEVLYTLRCQGYVDYGNEYKINGKIHLL